MLNHYLVSVTISLFYLQQGLAIRYGFERQKNIIHLSDPYSQPLTNHKGSRVLHSDHEDHPHVSRIEEEEVENGCEEFYQPVIAKISNLPAVLTEDEEAIVERVVEDFIGTSVPELNEVEVKIIDQEKEKHRNSENDMLVLFDLFGCFDLEEEGNKILQEEKKESLIENIEDILKPTSEEIAKIAGKKEGEKEEEEEKEEEAIPTAKGEEKQKKKEEKEMQKEEKGKEEEKEMQKEEKEEEKEMQKEEKEKEKEEKEKEKEMKKKEKEKEQQEKELEEEEEEMKMKGGGKGATKTSTASSDWHTTQHTHSITHSLTHSHPDYSHDHIIIPVSKGAKTVKNEKSQHLENLHDHNHDHPMTSMAPTPPPPSPALPSNNQPEERNPFTPPSSENSRRTVLPTKLQNELEIVLNGKHSSDLLVREITQIAKEEHDMILVNITKFEFSSRIPTEFTTLKRDAMNEYMNYEGYSNNQDSEGDVEYLTEFNLVTKAIVVLSVFGVVMIIFAFFLIRKNITERKIHQQQRINKRSFGQARVPQPPMTIGTFSVEQPTTTNDYRTMKPKQTKKQLIIQKQQEDEDEEDSQNYNENDETLSPLSTKQSQSQAEVQEVQRICYAPPGKLGVVVDTYDGKPVVHKLKPGSPLDGVLHTMDRIVGIDDVDTTDKSAAEVTKLMISKMRKTRKITYIRRVGGDDNEEQLLGILDELSIPDNSSM